MLLKFLANETDEAISQSLSITKATVRKHIEAICKAFGLSNDFSDERRSKRQDLVVLFAQYKRELLSGCASDVENEGAIANLKTPVSQGDESDLDTLVEKVRAHPHQRDKIQEQCGRLRILDVEWRVGIDNIYIDVNVLEKLPCNRYLELSDFKRFKPDKDDFDRLGLGNVREPQVPGLEAVARYSKLMLLGKPGSGKTTFLKFLAIQCIRGEFQKERIPIFIELKVFAKDAKQKGEFSLLNYINQELYICDVQAQQVEQLLHQGKFFILLDGLDEVKADIGDKIITEVCDFTGKYFRNHFVITCRIAAQFANQRYSLSFTDVEVADFDKEQIEAFAEKWFVTVARNSKEKGLIKAGQFIEKLYLPESQQIRELAGTPILLNLTCLVFLEKADFPSKRYKLYEQGLDILLERWDESWNIKRDEAYQKLSLEDKKELLSQVAFITFERGDYFFEHDQIQQLIADYLRTLPDAQSEPKALKRDSKAVLKSIEAQHGLLIERAREIYSFSHLTFQEYLSARKIITNENPKVLQQLVSHISDKRWTEVFVLVAGMLPSADYLLRLMKQKIDALIASDDLQQFLIWVSHKSHSTQIPDQRAAWTVRSFYLNLALSLALASDDFTPVTAIDLDLSSSLSLAIEVNPALQSAVGFALSRALEVDLALQLAIGFALPPDLKQALQQLKEQLPDPFEVGGSDPTKSLETLSRLSEWWRVDGQAWTERLSSVMIEYHIMDMDHDWQFSQEQIEVLQHYQEAMKLLLACLNSASKPVQKEIEETLLLPKDEIEQRKADGNSIFSS